jgi:hypothetical protein
MAPKNPQANEPKRVHLSGNEPFGYGAELLRQKKAFDLREAKSGQQLSDEQRNRVVKHFQKAIKVYNRSTEKSRKKAQKETNKQHRQQKSGGNGRCAVM